MSKVNIQYRNKAPEELEVPLFFRQYDSTNDVYMLIKDNTGGKKPYRLLSLSNGHVQAIDVYGGFDTVQEFIENNKEFSLVDVDITATLK